MTESSTTPAGLPGESKDFCERKVHKTAGAWGLSAQTESKVSWQRRLPASHQSFSLTKPTKQLAFLTRLHGTQPNVTCLPLAPSTFPVADFSFFFLMDRHATQPKHNPREKLLIDNCLVDRTHNNGLVECFQSQLRFTVIGLLGKQWLRLFHHSPQLGSPSISIHSDPK